MNTYITRYFLGIQGLGEFEVDKAKWVQAERACDFRPRYGRPDDEPCTGGFSKGPFVGRIKHEQVPTTVPTEPAIDPVRELAAKARLVPDPASGREWIEGQPF